jgi:predicted HTH transcriptional regulator
MSKLKVFVSSVQQELENERVAIAELISTDSFLSRHCEAVLFECLPASTVSTQDGYLAELDSSDVYVGIIGFEYGPLGHDSLSAMHREYLQAEQRRMPVLIFVKGHSGRDKDRSEKMKELFDRIRDSQIGHTYRRFANYQELKQFVRDALLPVLEKRGFNPSSAEQTEFEQTLSAASDFDTQLLNQVDVTDLDQDLARQYVTAVMKEPPKNTAAIQQTLHSRGLLWYDEKYERHRPTAAGLLLLGKTPDAVFPQCRIAANAYGGTEKGEPIDRRNIQQPLPRAIQESIDFLIRNMRHTQAVRGFARVELDEYPYEALREALINAVAHRDYGIRGASIRVEKYADRIVILSPGLPPPPLTLAKLRSLKYLPCSRNPNIARGLSFFERIEEQGDGLRRMLMAMKTMGLPTPEFLIFDGHFTVVFKGPGKSLAKLKPQKARPVIAVEPSIVDQLTPNQKMIVRELLKTREVQVPKIAALLKVTEQAIRKDMAKLQKMGLVVKRGSARATFYALNEQKVK